ncbi:MAG: phosphoserine phosphatase SerB [Candidatus Gastranaerophilales bacterium]|nr:phosphoserine phosphatase SerB [Candidatus Gastranaerophilales bacterium]
MKLAVFDFDSTLMDGETLEYIAQDADIKEKMKTITEKAMNGELDFFESLTQRVSYLKGMEVKHVNEICSNFPYIKGAKELIKELKSNNIKVICFSGGFANALIPAKEHLGFDEGFCNILHEKNGYLTGLVYGEMCAGNSKGIMLQKIQTILNISTEDTMTVGDGANDLSMFKYAGTKVAFCAKDTLKKAANVIVDDKNLLNILNHIKL